MKNIKKDWFFGAIILVIVIWGFYSTCVSKETVSFVDFSLKNIHRGKVLEISPIDQVGIYFEVRIDRGYNIPGCRSLVRSILAPAFMVENLRIGDIVYFYFVDSKGPYSLQDPVMVPEELVEKMIKNNHH